MLEAAHKLLPKDQAGSFVTAKEWMTMRKDTVNIRTGADSIDAILGGGVPTRSITEMFGEWRYEPREKPRPRETQLCALLTPPQNSQVRQDPDLPHPRRDHPAAPGRGRWLR